MSHDHTSDFLLNVNDEGVRNSGDVEVEMDNLGEGSQAVPISGGRTLGEFFKEINSIQEMIRTIKENMAAIEDLHKRTLVTVTEDESSRISRQLNLLISETSRVGGQINQRLTVIKQNNRSSTYATLAKFFMDTMTDYRNMQIENEKRYKDRIIGQYRTVKADAPQEEIDNLLDNNVGQAFTSQLLLETSDEQTRMILTEIKDRQHDVFLIENSIAELDTMLDEVQALVIAQDVVQPIEIIQSADQPTMQDATSLRSMSLIGIFKEKKLLWISLVLFGITTLTVFLVVFLVKGDS
ncbi:17610_t:CDS:10 [Acaulospora morrowiae]|uniref:17610_t:CDS:1 n=1 Tax=Acaulospora morrowiae TaxID=94023 RepID=A0A9N8Z5G4_9GLOM|nr:17610_t:CDS:10 [Acaulospora morrowiae]